MSEDTGERWREKSSRAPQHGQRSAHLAAWHMAGGGPPVTTKWVTVTRSDMIKFENANH